MAGLVTGDSIVTPDAKLTGAGVNSLINRVTEVDPRGKKVLLSSGKELAYDKLVLGMGSSPVMPPIPGNDLDGVFILRSLRHAEAMRQFLSDRKPRKLVLIGAGFVSLEIAILLKQADPECEITIIELLGYPLPTILDHELGNRVSKFLENKGLELRMGARLVEILGRDGAVSGVRLDSGDVIDAEMLFMNVGAKPNVDLARDAGLEMSQYGIKVNQFLETSDPDIMAAGDCADTMHFVTGRPNPGALRGPAVIMGRLVAKRLAGYEIPFPGILNACACGLIDLNIAATGLNEQQAKDEGFEPVSATVDSRSKHGMIPGMKPWILKLVFDKNSRKLIGGQIVSDDIPPVKEIDAVSALILGGKTVEDITVFMAAGNPDCSPEPSMEPIAIAGEWRCLKAAALGEGEFDESV
ncbi:MAG: FAD-dependent oxidoreductase, partial [candidate division Zixibacteria bacterium]|nr:FAD-dependent oxidoreductase [candidate division Zixibacteria bacterium]